MISQLKASSLTKGAALALLLALTTSPAFAKCGNSGGGFDSWLQDFKGRAASDGISKGTIASALNGIGYDGKVIQRDRNQHSFKLSFENFYARRVSGSLISHGRGWINSNRALANKIEKRFGVPIEVVVAIWGLETNYGADRGQGFSIVQALATLAYDCRRADFFEDQLMAALNIIDRGDMSAGQLRGGWAGEIGQTQFLPVAYVKYAVDFDGNGRRDLVNSVPDVLASTANFLKAHGWSAGGGYQPGSGNFGVIAEWNKAQVYQRTIAVMADHMK
jgi:lytic murein transglycosylase